VSLNDVRFFSCLLRAFPAVASVSVLVVFSLLGAPGLQFLPVRFVGPAESPRRDFACARFSSAQWPDPIRSPTLASGQRSGSRFPLALISFDFLVAKPRSDGRSRSVL
jgi:hypothetical protein